MQFTQEVESAWFQPLSLSSENNLVSKFKFDIIDTKRFGFSFYLCFQMHNLCRYVSGCEFRLTLARHLTPDSLPESQTCSRWG
jgi:hypothetical protein